MIEAIDRCADDVAGGWDSEGVRERDAVVEPLRAELESAGVVARLPAVLTDAVDAIGAELSAQPIAGPPYVAIASRGPVCRATLEVGRLVIRFDVFEVVRGAAPRYRRRDGLALVVSIA